LLDWALGILTAAKPDGGGALTAVKPPPLTAVKPDTGCGGGGAGVGDLATGGLGTSLKFALRICDALMVGSVLVAGRGVL